MDTIIDYCTISCCIVNHRKYNFFLKNPLRQHYYVLDLEFIIFNVIYSAYVEKNNKDWSEQSGK